MSALSGEIEDLKHTLVTMLTTICLDCKMKEMIQKKIDLVKTYWLSPQQGR